MSSWTPGSFRTGLAGLVVKRRRPDGTSHPLGLGRKERRKKPTAAAEIKSTQLEEEQLRLKNHGDRRQGAKTTRPTTSKARTPSLTSPSTSTRSTSGPTPYRLPSGLRPHTCPRGPSPPPGPVALGPAHPDRRPGGVTASRTRPWGSSSIRL